MTMTIRVAMKTNCVTMDVGKEEDAKGLVSVAREGRIPSPLAVSHRQSKLLRVGQTKWIGQKPAKID
jgi:hypothetical protein